MCMHDVCMSTSIPVTIGPAATHFCHVARIVHRKHLWSACSLHVFFLSSIFALQSGMLCAFGLPRKKFHAIHRVMNGRSGSVPTLGVVRMTLRQFIHLETACRLTASVFWLFLRCLFPYLQLGPDKAQQNEHFLKGPSSFAEL